jgi:hypothetical protein
MTDAIHGAVVTLRKARNGWRVEVSPQDRNHCDIYDDEGNPLTEEFVVAGDLDAEALGKEIVATLVSLRIGEPRTTTTPKKRR